MIDQIGATTGLHRFELGALGTLPVLMFGLCSPLAGIIAWRRGIEATIAAALVGMILGIVLRSTSGLPGLWVGTAMAGASIAIANVLTPSLVKMDFARPALGMALFTTALSGTASIASGTSVPISNELGGWRPGLLVWGVLPAAALLVWLARVRFIHSGAPPDPIDRGSLREMVRSRIAWQVAVFFGLQSLTFYTLITWLPTIDQSFGSSPKSAGFHLLTFQLVGCPIAILVGLLMERSTDQRLAAFMVSVPVVAAMVGFAALPHLGFLWAVIGAAGAGSSLTVGLALVLLRTKSSSQTTALSGMAQAFGYLVASVGPVTAGAIADHFGWRLVLLLLAVVAAAQAVLGLWAGRCSVVGAQESGVPTSIDTDNSPFTHVTP